jgi:hypothetical protein
MWRPNGVAMPSHAVLYSKNDLSKLAQTILFITDIPAVFGNEL